MLNLGVNDVRILAKNVEPDTPGITATVFVRQAFRQFFPGESAVGGLVNRAVRAAAVEAIRSASALVSGGIEGFRAFGIHGNVAYAGVVIDFQDLLPGLAAIAGLVNAPLRVGSPKMTLCRHINDFRIFRMNDDSADVVCFFQSHVLPGLAGIEGLVNAVAPRGTLAIIGLAGSDPNDRWVRWRDGDVADGRHALLIEDRLPRSPVVRSLPHTAGSCADVNDIRIAFAAHHGGANLAKLQTF